MVNVQKIALPAAAGNGKFWHRYLSSVLYDERSYTIKIIHFHGAGKCICSAIERRCVGRSLKQSAMDACCLYSVIGNGKAVFFYELPPKNLLIEMSRFFRILSLYFKLYNAVHQDIFLFPSKWIIQEIPYLS